MIISTQIVTVAGADAVYGVSGGKSKLEAMTKVNAVFRYPGSKWSIASWIIGHFPEGYEKLAYLEPFVGSGAVFLKKPGAVETINDLNRGCGQPVPGVTRAAKSKRALEMTPYSREEYDKAFEQCDDPVEKARRYMVKTTQAIGAKMCGKCGWRNHKQIKIGGHRL